MEQCKHRDVGTKYNYLKADYTSITSKLNKIYWDVLLSDESIDANWNLLKSNVLAIASKYIPKVEVTKKQFLTSHYGGLPKSVMLLRKSSISILSISSHARMLTMLITF